jgi:hypothetical protein
MKRMLTLRDKFCSTFCLLRLVVLLGVLLSANANESANCRLAYANTNNTPSLSNTNVSSRLSYSHETKKIMRNNDLGSCQNTNLQKRAGSENERARSEKQIIMF